MHPIPSDRLIRWSSPVLVGLIALSITMIVGCIAVAIYYGVQRGADARNRAAAQHDCWSRHGEVSVHADGTWHCVQSVEFRGPR